MRTAADILNELPFTGTFRTHADYLAHNKRAIQHAGATPVRAQYDSAGNCLYCGEAGRCPGWHTSEEPKRQDTEPFRLYHE